MARKQALKRIRDVEVGLGDGQDCVWQRVLGEGEMNCDQLAKSCGLAQTFSRTIKMQPLALASWMLFDGLSPDWMASH